MEKYRIGNDIILKWVVFRSGKQPEDFSKATIQELKLQNLDTGDTLLPQYTVKGNVFTIQYPASQQKNTGVYALNLKYSKQTSSTAKVDQYEIDKQDAFEIVPLTKLETQLPEIPATIESFVLRDRDGNDGITPEIGSNENWFFDGKDSGKPSRGRAFVSSDFTAEEWNEIKKPSLEAADVAISATGACNETRIATEAVKTQTQQVKDETLAVKSATEAVKTSTESVRSATEIVKNETTIAKDQTIAATSACNAAKDGAIEAAGNANTNADYAKTEGDKTKQIGVDTLAVKQATEAVKTQTETVKQQTVQAILDTNSAKDQTVAATNTCKTETTKCTTATNDAKATESRMVAILDLMKNGIDGGDATGTVTPI